jgi:hypothetical protein
MLEYLRSQPTLATIAASHHPEVSLGILPNQQRISWHLSRHLEIAHEFVHTDVQSVAIETLARSDCLDGNFVAQFGVLKK